METIKHWSEEVYERIESETDWDDVSRLEELGEELQHHFAEVVLLHHRNQQAEITRLCEELARARQDTERLDWIWRNCNIVQDAEPVQTWATIEKIRSIIDKRRGIIDAATESEKT